MKTVNRVAQFIIYAAVLLLSVLFLYIGNKVATGGVAFFDEYTQTVEAVVINIADASHDEYEMGGAAQYTKEIIFEAETVNGGREVITATQSLDSYSDYNLKEVEKGDRIILMLTNDEWHFYEYARINGILILGGAFIVSMIFFGRVKGINAILSLCLTCVAIFAVFIPSLLSGRNIYVSAIVVCVYSIVVTLFIVIGINRKSVAAIAGCFGGVISVALLTVLMTKTLMLTGMLDSESLHLLYLRADSTIDLRAIIFAGIIIGAVGAVMDVAMSISSALWELKSQAAGLKFAEIFKSGVNIGKDIMGTMANTLVLAYIGNSLTIILLLVTYSNSFAELMNRELIVVELLRAIVGSFGILLTMPLTALICAFLYSRK